MLRSLASRGATLCRTRFPAYSTERGPKPPSDFGEDKPAERSEDEPLWDMENPFKKSRRECILCQHKVTVDYKNVQLLSQFVSSYTGQLYPKNITGLCENQQQSVMKALLHARSAGLMPMYHKDMRFIRDPKLFDPLHPQRPNVH